jgi:hypothetical protein
MTTNTKTSARRSTPGMTEWGRKARKEEAKAKKGAAKAAWRADIRKGEA